MAKVFRLHTGAANTLNNWDDSVKIGSTAIDKIPDPVGATDKNEITSIPSPFARMDLVKNAFKYVSDHDLEGNTIYHKLVSDTLDVGQIFFNIEKYRDVIDIIVWDKSKALAELEQSAFDEHQRLGRTYDTFLLQDQDEYHFDKLDCIYLLNYKEGPDEMNIIGATSPATLFFTSANDLSFVGRGEAAITFGNDRPFDGNYAPLYNRDESYIKYWWSIKKSRPDFAALFPEVNSYLDKCFNLFSTELKRELQALTSVAYQEDYDDITVTPSSQNYVMVLDQRLKRKKQVSVVDSDFEMVIAPSLKKPGTKVPLALPVDVFNDPLKYVIDPWNRNTVVPFIDKRPIADRTLPEDGSRYPYVTISDFLEDYIIKIPYRFNSKAFFNGNDEKPEAKDSFLLPLKREFFNYFQVSDLKGKVQNKEMMEIMRLAGDTGVKVVLRIPVKGGFIKYERIYYKTDKPDVDNNKGAIVERDFTVGLFPAIKYAEDVTPYYRVSVLDRDTVQTGQNNRYELSFFDINNQSVEYDELVQRNKNSDGQRFDGDKVDSATYALAKGYQYIQVSDNSTTPLNAIVIPSLASKTGNHKFRFAIDFGTTNTHIEYSVDGESSKAFNIDESDAQIQKLHIIDDFELNDVLRSDFVAATIGGDSIYSYPMRTVLSETNNTNWARPVFSMAHANIPYTYEKSLPLSYNVLHTDLKWSTNNDDKLRAAMYIECLMIMLRNKVLLNNGDLSKTEIVWFYPASMTQSRFNKFKDEWERTFQKYFNAPLSNIISISESVAPYYFHRARRGATSTVVSIDIGGGTTDVLIVDKGEPKYLTSFRFAANTIFGDGYSYDADSNGFVNKYSPEILHLLDENNLVVLKSVLKSLLEKKVSTDIIAFFFSLAGNKETRNVIDFNRMLADDKRGKYVVILFYTAILYHIACIMKAKGFSMPRHITFSGNGSKILSILSTNNATLERFTKIIFEKIYGQKYSEDGLSIIRPDNSKESTCKGGVILNPFQSQDYSQINEMKTILLGSDMETFAAPKSSYDDIDNNLLSGVVDNTKHFIDFTFNLDKDFSFFNEFDVDKSILPDVKRLCTRDVKTYLENGISLKKQMLQQDGADNNIEETLFFYPLVGILNAVVREIYNL